MRRWIPMLVLAIATLVPMSAEGAELESLSPEEREFLAERGTLLDDLVDQLAIDELTPEARDVISSLSVLERESILDRIKPLLAEEEVSRIAETILSLHDGSPEIDSTRVPYYYRKYVWDTNDREWEYIYVFRLGTSSYPRYYRHWSRPIGTCWPTSIWIWGSQWWDSYYKDGSWYWEFLFSKTRVDALACYGYMELEYWY